MLNQNKINQFTKEAVEIRQKILEMIVRAHASHIASAYSSVEILVYLYNEILNLNSENISDINRDIFILSKGWSVSALYAVLAKHKFINSSELDSYCLDGSKLIGCATRNGTPGIEATTGSMGHGLPLGVGFALANKIKNLNRKVIVLSGDGELDEGSAWEAVLQAGHFKLNNLLLIIDCNGWQSFGKTENVLNLEPLAEKFCSFNWNTFTVNGHSYRDLDKVFHQLLNTVGKPSVIIAKTIKGKGVSVFEDRNEWHYKTPTAHEIEIANQELII
jgi:transketolase